MAKIKEIKENAIVLQDEKLNSDMEKDLKNHESKVLNNDYTSLLEQVRVEKEIAWYFMKPKFDDRLLRLFLYNNQKKDKFAIGDPLLFTIHQTVLASLVDDRLSVSFEGREEGDNEVASTLNSLALFDYSEMQKDVLDYDFDWDATFFGRALMMMMEFDRKRKCPSPEVIDVMTWLRDPRATSVNGDMKGRGAMKFGGREIRLSKREMDEAGIYSNYKGLKASYNDINSMIDEASKARNDAQNRGDGVKLSELDGDNFDIRAWEWLTHWRGRKVLVTMDNTMKEVLRFKELDTPYWPIIDRAIYPMAHDWDGVCIPDIIEDKQRARARVQNAALENIEANQRRTFLFDTNRITDPTQIANLENDKSVAIDGTPEGAVTEVRRSEVKAEVGWILNVLDTAAQKATATPDIQQGANTETKRTATELNLQSRGVDTRYSLSAKIFGWSEKRFWGQWYSLYKTHFEADIDEKIIRIQGALGSKWRKLTKENIIAVNDPDIIIDSKAVSDAKKFNQLQLYKAWVKDIIAIDPQNSNLRFAARKEGELSGFSKEEVQQILPPSIDEMNAEDENINLDDLKKVEVQLYDDDYVHMYIHNKAADTPQKLAHIKAHRKALMVKRLNPQFDIGKTRVDEAIPQGANNIGTIIKNNQTVPNQ